MDKQEKKPFDGIRWVDGPSVDNAYRMYDTNAKAKFHLYSCVYLQGEGLCK